jgi:hypothetical protein
MEQVLLSHQRMEACITVKYPKNGYAVSDAYKAWAKLL